MFDRDREWEALVGFSTDSGSGARLGVVSGRRRQGKTYLLRALCQSLGGFYFGAEEAADAESLRSMGEAIADHLGAPAPLALRDWHEAIDALLSLGADRPIPIVIDEFPYLVHANAALPSILQNALAPLRPERDRSRARLLLCGSAMSFMGGLLAGSAPLRGRAGLELVVRTFDHQLAREFWGINDLGLALRVHAVVGGTPAYRREYVRDDIPGSPEDFDRWMLRTVLNPASPLFREGRYLLAEEPGITDSALYHSVLAAIATGSTTRGAIASYLARRSGDMAHPLTVLQDAGLISVEPDGLRGNRTGFRIDEPVISFYHAVMRPIWSDLEHTRDASRLWARSQRRFQTKVLGPHFEQVCRYWTRHMAPKDLFSGDVDSVSSGTVGDPNNRTSHEVDVVVTGYGEDGGRQVLALGEAKFGETIEPGHLERLRRIRSLLAGDGRHSAGSARLILYGGAGFSDALHSEAARSADVTLVRLEDLYRTP